MLVQAKQAFVSVANGQTTVVRVGQTVDMPDGADWLQAGLVEPIAPAAIETAALDVNAGTEQATARRRRRTL